MMARPLAAARSGWLPIVVAAILAFLCAPIVITVVLSFSSSSQTVFPPPGYSLRWYESYVMTPEWRRATAVSFSAATLTMLLATPLGTAAAYGIARSPGRLAEWVRGTLILPMLIPTITLAIGIYYVFALLGLVNTLTGLVLAHTAGAIPLVLITVSVALKQFDEAQEAAARSLGASRLYAFATVTLPAIKGPVAAAALLAFMHSLDEIIIALFISSGDNATLTRRFFVALRDFVDPTIAAISTLLIVTSFVLIGLSELLQRKAQP